MSVHTTQGIEQDIVGMGTAQHSQEKRRNIGMSVDIVGNPNIHAHTNKSLPPPAEWLSAWACKQADWQAARHVSRCAGRRGGRQAGRRAGRQMGSQAERNADKKEYRRKGIQTERNEDRQGST